MLMDMCNKICPFKPNVPECSKCAKVYSQANEIQDMLPRRMLPQPEAIVVEPSSHAIMFTPEVVVTGIERKQCCYLDQCSTVPLDAECGMRCYEPCDAVCTGHCLVNPQCPHECDKVRLEQYKLRYQMWLAQKLNQIKLKYRAMATACLLKTRLAFDGEVQNYYQVARNALARLSNGIMLNDEEENEDDDIGNGQGAISEENLYNNGNEYLDYGLLQQQK